MGRLFYVQSPPDRGLQWPQQEGSVSVFRQIKKASGGAVDAYIEARIFRIKLMFLALKYKTELILLTGLIHSGK